MFCRSVSSSAGRCQSTWLCSTGRWFALLRSQRSPPSRCCHHFSWSAPSAKSRRRLRVSTGSRAKRPNAILYSGSLRRHGEFYRPEGDTLPEPKTEAEGDQCRKTLAPGSPALSTSSKVSGIEGVKTRGVQARRAHSRQGPLHPDLRVWQKRWQGGLKPSARMTRSPPVAVSSAQPCTGETRVRPPTDAWSTVDPTVDPFFALFQIRQRVAEALQADRDANAGFRRIEDDEHGGASAHHLLDHLVLQHHLGYAALLAAFEERRVADILVIDLESKAGGQEHAERHHDAQQLLILADGFVEHHGQPDIWPVLRGHALHQRAFLLLGAWRRATAHLPGSVGLLHHAAGAGCLRVRVLRTRGERSDKRSSKCYGKHRGGSAARV